MERNNRKVYTGTVISTKMDKTITVLVETHVKHKLYGNRMNSSRLWQQDHYLQQSVSV